MPRSSRLWGRLASRRTAIASWLALMLVVGGLAMYAIGAQGEPVHHADLNDGGVWISSEVLSASERINTPVSQPNAYVGGDGAVALQDVLQDGSAVVGLGGTDGGAAIPVSTTTGKLSDKQATVSATPVLEGGTIAVVDPQSGSLWAQRVDPDADIESLSSINSTDKKRTVVGGDAALTVSTDGTVFAASYARRTLTTLVPQGDGFAKPVTAKLAVTPTGGIVSMTAVGDTPVLLDKAGDVIVGAHRVSIGGEAASAATAVLQQPSAVPPSAAPTVAVATDGKLESISLGDGTATDVVNETGTPSQPVRMGACIFGAWNQGTLGAVHSACDGAQPDPNGVPQVALGADAKLVFRVNRNMMLLNDVHNGPAWDLSSTTPTEINDWTTLSPTQQQKNSRANKQVSTAQVKQPPQATADTLGARPGGTTVLHVLDNDKVSGGGVLAITDVDPPKDPGISVQPSPDRESLLLTLSASITKSFAFRYTISDGTGGKNATADGDVTINVKTDSGSAVPTMREQAPTAITYPVVRGHSIEIPVTDGWRDKQYGDPVTLAEVKPAANITATGTPDGLIRVTPTQAGTVSVPYSVSTGGAPAHGSVSLNVLPLNSIKPVAPVAEPDVVAGQAGGAIVVHPLDNDIAGADATDAGAHLEIAGKVAPTGGLRVDTDLSAGTVTVHANTPGTYRLRYAAGYGAAARSQGDIMVLVAPASGASDLPIATPDQTTVRGTEPMTVDVLANDYDPQGRLLAVQHAEPADPNSPLDVAVVGGHWLRINATTTDMEPKKQNVSYTISNGDNSVTGTVAVTQIPLPTTPDNPITGPDSAVVRSGDTVVVPVLDNDSTPSGAPVGLRVPQVKGLPGGQVPVEESIGHAYVSGNHIRYVAPTVTTATTVHVDYTAENTADPQRPESAGVLTLNITSPPDPKLNPNQPPTPREIDARVVEGDTVALKLPLVGNDPDGDSVAITGVSSAPQFGRVLGFGATSMSYQAFPGSTGTDEFDYTVTDRQGASAQGTVRVAVVPPGTPQAPVAVDDVVTAAPGRLVAVDVLANDLRTPGTVVTIEPLTSPKAKLQNATGPIKVTASNDPKQAVVVPYRITNGISESSGQLTVLAQKDYDNPPVVQDVYAKPGPQSGSTTVDVLAKAYDIDDDAPLKVSVAPETKASVAGGRVTVPVGSVPQVVPFVVIDARGATSAAAIYVPARPKDFPYLKSGAALRLDPGQTKDFALSDIVGDPEGDHVVLTLNDKIVAAPQPGLRATSPKGKSDQLKLTADKEQGPGSVTFEVSDNADITSPRAHKATLTVPVQIGSTSSKLTCPSDPLTVYTGGTSQTVNVASVCHVWTQDPTAAGKLTFAASWVAGQQPTGVTVQNTKAGIVLKGGVNAVAGQSGTLAVGPTGGKATAQLHVRVLAAPPPTLTGITLQGDAGKPVTVDLRKYATSPFGANARWKLVGTPAETSKPDKAPPAAVKASGTTLTITPGSGADAHGAYAFSVQLTDSGIAKPVPGRSATTTIAMNVVAPPDKVDGVHSDGQVYDARVELLWTPPSANGGTVSSYTVSYNGGSQECASSPCSISGLSNGTTYTFTVVAHNQYGDSVPSGPAQATPDRTPDQVTRPVVTQQADHAVTLSWQPPVKHDFSPIEHYYISYPGGGVVTVPPGTLTKTVSVPANGENTEFAIWAENKEGPSPKVSVTGMGAGKPAAPVMTAPVTSDVAGGTQKAATLSWGEVGANGPDPVQYQVTRSGDATPVCSWQASTRCEDKLPTDGTKYTYTVQARSGEATSPHPSDTGVDAYTSAQSSPVTVEAATTPEPVSITSFTPTGNNGQAKVVFNVGASHGSTNQVVCSPACPGVSTVPNSGQSNVTATLSGLTNGSATTISIKTCNNSSGNSQTGAACSAAQTATATTYGDIGAPSLSVSASGQSINWSYSGDANGRPVDIQLKMDGTVIKTQTSGNGSYSNSGSQNVGYSHTGNFTLTVSDASSSPNGARASKTVSGSATTPSQPKVVTVTPDTYGGAQGQSGCSEASCTYIGATLSGFTGTVTCTVANATWPGGTAGFISWQAGNGYKKGPDYSGWRGKGYTVTVTCGGVTSNPYSW